MSDWSLAQVIVFIAPFVLVAAGVTVWLLMRRSVRTRIEMERQLRADPDISEHLVVFGWTRKIIYFPTVILSLLFFVLSLLGVRPGALGAIWFVVFLFNFLIEEYEVGMKELLIFVFFLAGAMLWMHYIDWLEGFFDSIGGMDAELNGVAYLVFSLVFLTAIGVSWIRGLFNYVVFTPNYVNLQKGPTESGDHVSREEYDTIIDTGDLPERLLGFGKITVSFHDIRRPPQQLLVWGIGRKSRRLESIKGIITIERHSKAQPVE